MALGLVTWERGALGRVEGKRAGPRREGKEQAGLGRLLGWVLVFLVSFSYFFSLFLFPLNSKLFEFKLKFEFKTLAPNQIKQCTNMNAQAC